MRKENKKIRMTDSKSAYFLEYKLNIDRNEIKDKLKNISEEIKNTTRGIVKQIPAIVFVTGLDQSGIINPSNTKVPQQIGVRQTCFISADILDSVALALPNFFLIVIIIPVTMPTIRTISQMAHNILRAIVS